MALGLSLPFLFTKDHPESSRGCERKSWMDQAGSVKVMENEAGKGPAFQRDGKQARMSSVTQSPTWKWGCRYAHVHRTFSTSKICSALPAAKIYPQVTPTGCTDSLLQQHSSWDHGRHCKVLWRNLHLWNAIPGSSYTWEIMLCWLWSAGREEDKSMLSEKLIAPSPRILSIIWLLKYSRISWYPWHNFV